MVEYITKIRTETGDKQIDYDALANLPQADATLSQAGKFADAAAVGDAINDLDENKADSTYVNEFKTNIENAISNISNNKADITYVDQKINDKLIDSGNVPPVTASDNGKFLRVIEGTPAWQALTNASEVGF